MKWLFIFGVAAFSVYYGAFWKLAALVGILTVGVVGSGVSMEVKMLRLTLETLRCPLCGAPFNNPHKPSKPKKGDSEQEVVS